MTVKFEQNYLNPYQGVHELLKGVRGFSQNDWDYWTKKGRNELNTYATIMSDVASGNIDYDAYQREYLPELGDEEYRMATLSNELYADKENKTSRKVPVYSNGEYVDQKVEMSDYEYNKYMFDIQRDMFTQEGIIKARQSMKDSMSWIEKRANEVGAGLAHLGTGLLVGFDGFARLMNGTSNAIIKLTHGNVKDAEDFFNEITAAMTSDDYGEIFGQRISAIDLERIQRDLAEFEMYGTDFMDFNGDRSWWGNAISSIGESFGRALPSMVNSIMSSTIPGYAPVGATLQPYINAMYWSGMAGTNIKESVENMPVDTSSIAIVINGSIKAAMEYAVQEGLNIVLNGLFPSMSGRTMQDQLMFGYKNTGKVTDKFLRVKGLTKKGISQFFFDAIHEGIEESLQEISGGFVDSVTAMITRQPFDKNNELTLENIGNAFAVAAISSIFSGSLRILTTKSFDTGIVKTNKKGEIIYKKGTKIAKTKKLNKFASFALQADLNTYNQNLNRLINAVETDGLYELDLIDNVVGTNHIVMTADERRAAIEEMYIALRSLTSVYGTMGEERYNAALEVLKNIDEYNTTNTAMAVNEADKLINSLAPDINKDIKANLVRHIGKYDDIKDTVTSNEDERNALDKKVEELKDNGILNIELFEDGDGPLFGKDFAFIQLNMLKNETVEQILKAKTTQEFINDIISIDAFRPAINEFRKIYEEISTENEITDYDLMLDVMFNISLHDILLVKSNRITLQFFGKLLEIERKAFSSKNNRYFRLVKQITDDFNKRLFQYCILNDVISEFDYTQYVFSINKETDNAIKNKIRELRYGKDVKNRLLTEGEKLTDDDYRLLDSKINASPIIDTEKERVKQQMRSDDVKIRKYALREIFTLYRKQFYSPFDDFTYFIQSSSARIAFNTFAQQKGYTVMSTISLDVERIRSEFEAWSGGKFTLANGEPTNKSVSIYSDISPITRMGPLSLNTAIALDRQIEDEDKRTVNVTNNVNNIDRLVRNDLSSYQKAYYTITDLLNNPGLFNKKVLDFFNKQGYKIDTREGRFIGLRAYIHQQTGFRQTLIVDNSGTKYLIVDTKPMMAIYKNADLSNFDWTKKDISKLKITDIIDERYLIGKLRDIKFKIIKDVRYNGYYDEDTNTININEELIKNSDTEEGKINLRRNIAHEFQHAIQSANSMVSGFDGSFIFDMPLVNAKSLAQDFMAHFPDLFDDKDRALDLNNRNNLAVMHLYWKIGQQIYLMTGEVDANGFYANAVNSFYPIVVPSDVNKFLIMPWGDRYLLKTPQMPQPVKMAETKDVMINETDNIGTFIENLLLHHYSDYYENTKIGYDTRRTNISNDEKVFLLSLVSKLKSKTITEYFENFLERINDKNFSEMYDLLYNKLYWLLVKSDIGQSVNEWTMTPLFGEDSKNERSHLFNILQTTEAKTFKILNNFLLYLQYGKNFNNFEEFVNYEIPIIRMQNTDALYKSEFISFALGLKPRTMEDKLMQFTSDMLPMIGEQGDYDLEQAYFLSTTTLNEALLFIPDGLDEVLIDTDKLINKTYKYRVKKNIRNDDEGWYNLYDTEIGTKITEYQYQPSEPYHPYYDKTLTKNFHFKNKESEEIFKRLPDDFSFITTVNKRKMFVSVDYLRDSDTYGDIDIPDLTWILNDENIKLNDEDTKILPKSMDIDAAIAADKYRQTYIKKSIADTNPLLEPFKGRLIDNKIYNLLSNIDMTLVDTDFADMINGVEKGTLDLVNVKKYVRTHEWKNDPTDKYTYDLIKKYVFPETKNLPYRTFLHLTDTLLNKSEDPFNYKDNSLLIQLWAMKYAYKEQNKDLSVFEDDFSSSAFAKILSTIRSDKDLSESYLKFMERFDTSYYAIKRNGKSIPVKITLPIEQEYTKLALLQKFDMSLNSLIDSVNLARLYTVYHMRYGEKDTTSFSKKIDSKGDNLEIEDTLTNDTIESVVNDALADFTETELIEKLISYIGAEFVSKNINLSQSEMRKGLFKIRERVESLSLKQMIKLLTKYEIKTGLDSSIQTDELSDNIERVVNKATEKQLRDLKKNRRNVKRNVMKLTKALNLDKKRAKYFLKLYNDIFKLENNEYIFTKDIENMTIEDLKTTNEKVLTALHSLEKGKFLNLRNFRGAEPKTKTKTVVKTVIVELGEKSDNTVFELYNDGKHGEGKQVPSKLERLMNYEFDKRSQSEVKWINTDDEGKAIKNKDNVKLSMKNFMTENERLLSTLTNEEVADIIEFYKHNALAVSVDKLNETALRKWYSIEVSILTWIKANADDGSFALTVDQMNDIDAILLKDVRVSATVLSVWKSVMKSLDPTKKRMKALAMKYGIIIDDYDIDRLRDAISSDDLARIQEAKQKMYENSMAKYKEEHPKATVDQILNKIIAFQRMMMLSGPGTWARNFTSNQVLRAVNTGGAVIGHTIAKKALRKFDRTRYERISKFVNTSNQTKHLSTERKNDLIRTLSISANNQYKIVGTKVSDDVKEFLTTYKSTLDLVSEGSTKYDERVSRSDVDDVLKDMITNSVARTILQKTTFGDKNKLDKSLQWIYDFVDKMISDEKFIKKRAEYYLARMLQERSELPISHSDRIDLSRGLTKEVLQTVAEAYSFASEEFMHKTNFISFVEKQLKMRLGDKAYFVYKQFFPFLSASWNWSIEALKYNPISLVKSIVDYARLERTIFKLEEKRRLGEQGISSRFSSYLIKQNIGKGVIGTIGIMIGMILSALGIIRVDGDDEDKLKLTVEINDTKISVDISSLFITSSLLAGAALIPNKYNEDYNIVDALNQAGDMIFDNTVFSDIIDMFRYSQGVGDFAASQLESFLNKFVPNFTKTLYSLMYSHNIQYSKGIKGSFERFINNLIPGMAYALPSKIDPYTGEVQNAELTSNGWWAWVNKSTKRLSNIGVSVKNISETEKMAISVGLKKGELTGNYSDIGQLNAKDLDVSNRKYGELNKKALDELRKSNKKYRVQMEDGSYDEKSFSKMSDKQKKAVINRIMTANAKYAKIYIYTLNGGKYYAEANEYEELKSLGIRINVYRKIGKKNGFM